jgi:uncharacterized membrane protein YfcA
LENLPLFILLALLAEILGTIGGFGSSLFFIPIASYFLDFHSVLGVTALFHVSSNLAKIGIFKGGFDKKIALSLGIPAVVFVIIGALLSKYVETKFLEITLSIFLILISLFFLFKKEFQVKPTFANTLGGGIFSGFVAGLIGTGGAIRGIVLASYNLKMEVFIVTSAMIDLCIDASRSVVYLYNGYMHKDDLYLIPILLVISIVGTFIGKKILLLVSEKQFKSFVLILVFITGCLSLIKFIN